MLLKNNKSDDGREIQKGIPFLVRPIQATNLLGHTVHRFQIIDLNSPFSGEFLRAEDCIECIDLPKQKTYSEKQVNVMKDFHKKELEQAYQQKERAQQLVTNLTESIKKRNAKIESLEYCVNVLAGSLHAMTEAFHKLKALEKFQNR